ncbi:MAG: hypothetical protein DI582_08100 [Azospirillum brasilense]|nr:MAG: hypothetical protein DI582_08100 [Azospirillum brasilense]
MVGRITLRLVVGMTISSEEMATTCLTVGMAMIFFRAMLEMILFSGKKGTIRSLQETETTLCIWEQAMISPLAVPGMIIFSVVVGLMPFQVTMAMIPLMVVMETTRFPVVMAMI